jgi:hypothetical protein
MYYVISVLATTVKLLCYRISSSQDDKFMEMGIEAKRLAVQCAQIARGEEDA